MSPVRVTWARTLGAARNVPTTAIACAAFFAAAAAQFAFSLEAAEGSRLSLAALWTMAAAPPLPVLAALLGMGVWSEERRTGRIETLLATGVRERDFTLGKFLGVWTMTMVAVLVFLVSSLAFLAAGAPRLLAGATFAGFLPGFFALALQGALWCAVAVLASACCANAAVAALATVTVLVAVPRGAWWALLSWAPQGRLSIGDMTLDANAYDLATGVVSLGTVATYAILTVLALFLCSKAVAALRFVGRGSRTLRLSTLTAAALALVLAGLTIALAHRLEVTVEIPVGGGELQLSSRTRGILAEGRGHVFVTAFMSRRDPRFRDVAHLLRALAREEAPGGLRVSVRFVDPKWDVAEAGRLVRAGVPEDSLVFERGHRRAAIRLADGYGEWNCASTLLRVALPPQRRNICWTSGHGEGSFETYGSFGMSDIARDLAMDGYRNAAIDLAKDAKVPDDCALVVIAGAKDEFSRAEMTRLDAYLRQGGRLLVLVSSAEADGVATMLAEWGLRPVAASFPGARTLSGTDVIVSDFSDHPVVRPLAGSQIVLEKPVAFTPSAAADAGTGADVVSFAELAKVGGAAVAAVAERGGRVGADLSIRPTRIIAVGDATFALNGQLTRRGNANRDFFLNAVAYLSGTDAVTRTGAEAGQLVSGLDRAGRQVFFLATAVAFPLAVLLVLSTVLFIRRRRL